MATVGEVEIETRDLRIVPEITFTDVEHYITTATSSSGKLEKNKGYKYFCEEYVFNIKTTQVNDGCKISGKCHRSMRKNESPHNVLVSITSEKKFLHGHCSCANGLSGSCGHVTAILYKIADFKKRNMEFIPYDIAKTSIRQTWHEPRGEKILGQPLQDISFVGFTSGKKEKQWTLESSLYNPILQPLNPASELAETLKDCNNMFSFALSKEKVDTVKTTMGNFPKGSPLSYQLKKETSICNIHVPPAFPKFPIKNVMDNYLLSTALTRIQQEKLLSLQMTTSESITLEFETQLQAMDPRWHKLRQHRITASVVGDVAKRKDNFDKLAMRLKTERHVSTKAMKNGIANEPFAADSYNKLMGESVNIYRSGVVIHPTVYWMAATPDRKVYDPSAVPPYGLLEIKCPYQKNSLDDLKYLQKNENGFKLKIVHNYYYQVQMQMAVTGTDWCDFFVWDPKFQHLERIHFDLHFWNDVRKKVDIFYFNYFL